MPHRQRQQQLEELHQLVDLLGRVADELGLVLHLQVRVRGQGLVQRPAQRRRVGPVRGLDQRREVELLAEVGRGRVVDQVVADQLVGQVDPGHLQRALLPVLPGHRHRRPDRQVLVVGHVVGDQRAAGAEVGGAARLHRQVDGRAQRRPVQRCRELVGPGDGRLAAAQPGHLTDARGVLHGLERGLVHADRGRADDVVGADRVRGDLADAVLQRRAEHADRRHQRQADHQRGRGDRGAPRVAPRVQPAQPAGQPTRRTAGPAVPVPAGSPAA